MNEGNQNSIENESVDSEWNSEDQSRCLTIYRYFIKGLKRLITFLFSHVGLTCVIVGYSFLGGIVFKAIELPNEKEIRQEAVATVVRYQEQIANFTNDDNGNSVLLNRALWNQKLEDTLKKFEQEMHKLTKESDWDGQLADEPYQWTFANSLLYSVTIITTIGYGNVTPKTPQGRLVTIIYAVLGIPLTLLCLRNIGDILAGLFRIGYRMCCTNMTYQYIKLKRRRIKKRFVKRLQKKTNLIKSWATSKHSIVSSIIHHRQLSSTSREGEDETRIPPNEGLSSDEDEIVEIREVHDIDDGENGKDKKENHRVRSQSLHTFNRHACQDHHEFHRKLSMADTKAPVPTFERVVSTMNDLSIIPEDSCDFDLHRPVSPKLETDNEKVHRGSSTISDLSLRDFEEDDLRLKERLKSTRDFVPISVCLLLITGYMIGGAILFTSWEKEWDFLIGFYFCFVTLSTIGFGDFVPGMLNANLDDDGRRVICIVYLVVGMALLSMSFYLIQEEVCHKFRKIAIKLGLVEERLTQLLDSMTQE